MKQRLPQERLEMFGSVLYILLFAWKRKGFSLKVGKSNECEGGIKYLGLCWCLVPEHKIAVLCKCPNVCAPGTGEAYDDLCII